ncbi:MAG: cytochrome P450 [Sulfitobacter sp.]|mgnify:FL=1|jgi:fatty-acid peroxygenase
MPDIPQAKGFDSTLALLQDPYGYISRTCVALGSDLFETRVLMQRTICMTGPALAQIFYEQEHFSREGAMPRRIQKTLLGQGGVQGLDGKTHRHRKQMFMGLMGEGRIAALQAISSRLLKEQASRWENAQEVVLYDEVRTILTKAVCEWSGVPLPDAEVALRTAQLTALFQDAGAVGWRHWKARAARARAEHWAAEIIRELREGRLLADRNSAAYVVAMWRNLDGELLPVEVAAVEILNVLRPTVAVSVFIVQVAHALQQNPTWAQRLRQDDENLEIFVQEVRRLYRFFPVVAARVKHDFEWQGYRFPKGTRVLLDLYGTNTDPRTWKAPDAFLPDRFRAAPHDPFNFIPQGGGAYHENHRCPGEWIAISQMKTFCDFLVNTITYDLPQQALEISPQDLPPVPKDGIVLRNVSRS